MAGLGAKLLSGILGKLKSLFTSIPSFIQGFDVADIQSAVEGEIYKASISLNSTSVKDVNGNPISLNVILAATGVDKNDIIKISLDGIKNIEEIKMLNPGNAKQKEAFIALLGFVPDTKEPDSFKSNNANSEGILYPLDPKATTIPNSADSFWGIIADEMTYALRCEAEGYSGGEVKNVNYAKVVDLVNNYLGLCGAVDVNDIRNATTSDKLEINPTSLVMPILLMIQEHLKELLDSTISSVYNQDSQQNNQENQSQENNNSENANQNADQNADQNAENTFTDNVEPSESSTESGINMGSSKKLNIKLQKITGSTDIDLMAIKANFNPGEALTAVDDVLSSPDFIELITETPQSYEVLVDDEGYDVNPCTDLIVEPNENLTQLFIQAIQFSRNLHMIHWLAIGNDMEKLHIKAEELYNELDEEIDLLAELIVEKTGTIMDINKIETWDTVGTQDRTFQQGIECIKQYAQSFIDYIDITYPNQPSDVQSILDDWLRYWNKQLNYFIVREQEI